MKKAIIIVVIFLALLAAGIYLANHDSKPVSTGNSNSSNDLSKAPDSATLLANMHMANLDALSAEGTVMHIHQHLDININSQVYNLPSHIGIANTFISPIHTHDQSGIIHVESPVVKDFKLGQFFTEWGVTLNDTCIANFCSDSGHKFVVGVNGQQIHNPQDYVLKPHDEIEFWYGPSSQNPTLIKSYTFPEGY